MTKIITTKDYILWVDTEAEVPDDKTWYTPHELPNFGRYIDNHHTPVEGKLVLGHRPLNNAPKLEGVLLLPSPVYALKAWSYGGSTGVNDYLMSDGSIQAFKPHELPKREIFDLNAEITKLNTPSRYDNHRRGYVYSEGDILYLFDKADLLPKQEDDVEQFILDECQTMSDAGRNLVRSALSKYKENTAKWSNEQIIQWYEYVRTNDWIEPSVYLESLSPATLSVDFEPEKELDAVKFQELTDKWLGKSPAEQYFKEVDETCWKLKIAKTEEGETIVGKWIFK